MKITKEEFDKLYDDSISKFEYDNIISKIDERFNEIIDALLPNIRKRGWVDYGNCSYYSDGPEGYFDPKKYREWIEIAGEYASLPDPYNYNFPTRWLWEDTFKEEFDKEVLNAKINKMSEKEKKKQKRIELQERKNKFRKVIESKLTKEELKYVSFN